MIEKNNNPRISAAAADGATPLAPEQIVEQLRILRQHVPDFGPLAAGEATALRTAALVHPEFVLASINTIGASQHISQAVASDAPALLTERQEADRWSAVEDELRTMLKGVAASNLARRHRIGLISLQTYSIARQLIRQKEHADLLPHVENMRRTNRLGRKRPVTAATPETPAPQPIPGQTPAPPTTPPQPPATAPPVSPKSQ